MSAVTTLGEHIRRLEEKLLRPEIRQSEAALAALLAEEFVEFASDGATYTKAQVIAALQREVPFVRSLTDFRFVVLGENVALVTYRTARRDEASGEVVESLRSSVWTERNGRYPCRALTARSAGPCALYALYRDPEIRRHV